MVKVIAKFIAKDKEVENIKELFAKIVPLVRKEDGNITYNLYQDVQNRNIVTMIEEWKNIELLDAHMQTALIQDVLEKIEKHTVNVEISIYSLLIWHFQAKQGTELILSPVNLFFNYFTSYLIPNDQGMHDWVMVILNERDFQLYCQP